MLRSKTIRVTSSRLSANRKGEPKWTQIQETACAWVEKHITTVDSQELTLAIGGHGVNLGRWHVVGTAGFQVVEY
jgi:hypothetical protein